MLNNSMIYHFIYKTTHQNGKYYIGRHSTENLDDGYVGSGLWPKSIKDRKSLTREILEFVYDAETLKKREGEYLREHYGQPGCMNATPDPVGFDTDNNPMKRPEVAAKLSGDNHYMRQRPEAREKSQQKQNYLVEQGIHNLLGDKNPNRDGRNAKTAMERGTHVNIANNPSKWRSKQGIHHWQNGNSPNAGGKLNRKLIEEGTHNFLGPEHNRRMIEEGKNPWVGPDANLKRLAEGTHPSQIKKTCEHCGKESSIGMYKRWHGDKCRTLKETL
jgi:hypothetical protein